jgi:stress-induced-phosphoprotein 1
LKEYEEASRRNPDNAKYYSNIGQTYIKLMEFQRAKESYDTVLKKDPECHFFLKEYHKALEVYELGLKKDPNDKFCKEGLEKTQQAIYVNNSQEDQEVRAKRAMADPEIQAILATPEVRNALADLERDPKSIQNILKDRSIAQKIEKLIAAGILRTG